MKTCNRFVICVHFIVLYVTRLTSSQGTIADAINYLPELSMIRKCMVVSQVITKLRQPSSSYTFFAPHNKAFENVSEQVRAMLNSPTLRQSDADRIFSYHLANDKFYTTNVSSAKPVFPISTTADGSPKLFLVKAGEVFINGARFVRSDLDTRGNVSNGVLHIIDRIFIDKRVSVNAYSVVTSTSDDDADGSDKTTLFAQLLDYYTTAVNQRVIIPSNGLNAKDSLLNNDQMYHTAFIPNDQALSSIKSQYSFRYSTFNGGDRPLLQRVIESHLVPYKPLHTNVLETLSTSETSSPAAIYGSIRAYRLNGQLYVSNYCSQARIIKANITATNAVVHIIDNLLGFVFNNIFDRMREPSDYSTLNEFRGVIDSAPSEMRDLMSFNATGNVPDSRKITVFAPIVDAIKQVDFSLDPTEKSEQIKQHIVQGLVDVFRMTNGTVMDTLRTGSRLRFYQFGDTRYVEVDHVRAKIVQAGLCCTNGMIYKVDAILGVPSRTVYGEVHNNAQLDSLDDVIIYAALVNTLNNMGAAVTLFAPIDFSKMRQSSLGVSLLDTRLYQSRLKNLMLRHIVGGYQPLEMETGSHTSFSTYYDTITISRDTDGEYYVLIGQLRIRIVRPNMRMKNGFVHIIEQPIFDPFDPTTGKSVSSAHSITVSSPINQLVFNSLILSVIVHVLCRR